MNDKITLPRADALQIRGAIRGFYNKYLDEAAHEEAGLALATLDAALAEPAVVAAAVKAEREACAKVAAKYDELLMRVGQKHPGETRHETALRYITQAEQRGVSAAIAKAEGVK